MRCQIMGVKYDQLLITGNIILELCHNTIRFFHTILAVRFTMVSYMCVLTTTTPFRVVVTHLSPWESKKRLLEVQALLMVVEGVNAYSYNLC